jgi:hypothetical protein
MAIPSERSDPRKWPVSIFRQGEEPGDDISAQTTAEERIEMVWLLTARMSELAKLPKPNYSRSNIPVRIIRR